MIHSASRSSSKYATQPITALAILADYALARETGELSAETLISVRRCVLDCVASSIAGANSDGAKAARIMAQTAFGDGPCSLWFSDKKLPAA
ncbi:MAG: MmgE/PrpD family protein, partial [Rhizobiales bacterium]|nr:MmgE/PrpD family protein [Hyphomicrobiales bacterium]